jgi:hypothetical protein
LPTDGRERLFCGEDLSLDADSSGAELQIRLSPEFALFPDVPSSHTSTREWQSFEARMRQRRAERCLLRASAALDAEVPDAASEVLAEARALCPDHPEIEAVSTRLSATSGTPPSRRRLVPRWLAAAVIGGAIGAGWGSTSVWTADAAVTQLVRVVTTTAAQVAAAASNLVTAGRPSP